VQAQAHVQGQAQAAIHQVQGQAEALKEQAHAVQAQVLQVLPPSVGAAVLAKEAALAQQAKAQVLQALPPVIAGQVLQVLPPAIAEQAHAPIEQKGETVLTFAPVPVQTEVAPVPVQTEVAHIAVSADQVEAIRAFLEQKATVAKN
jgi:hypothetical protein